MIKFNYLTITCKFFHEYKLSMRRLKTGHGAFSRQKAQLSYFVGDEDRSKTNA